MSEKTPREQRFEAWMEKMMKAEDEVRTIIKPIIDKFDPESLMKFGCPADEYDPEAKLIASAIVREGMNRMSERELGNLIAFAWHHEFGCWGQPINYRKVFFDMAEEILPLLPDYDTFRKLHVTF